MVYLAVCLYLSSIQAWVSLNLQLQSANVGSNLFPATQKCANFYVKLSKSIWRKLENNKLSNKKLVRNWLHTGVPKYLLRIVNKHIHDTPTSSYITCCGWRTSTYMIHLLHHILPVADGEQAHTWYTYIIYYLLRMVNKHIHDTPNSSYITCSGCSGVLTFEINGHIASVCCQCTATHI